MLRLQIIFSISLITYYNRQLIGILSVLIIVDNKLFIKYYTHSFDVMESLIMHIRSGYKNLLKIVSMFLIIVTVHEQEM